MYILRLCAEMPQIERATDDFLPTFAFSALKDAEKRHSEHKHLPDETLQSLHALFGCTFTRAANLLDRCKIVEYRTENAKRRLFKLRKARAKQYTLFNDVNFCTCKAFEQQVVSKRAAFTCKHVLAVKLAQIVGRVRVETITDLQLAGILSDE